MRVQKTSNNETYIDTTLLVSQSLFDSEVTGITARNKFPIQSFLKIPFRFRNDVSGYYTHFEPGSPVDIRKREQSVPTPRSNVCACVSS